jgi:hypothetical protein
MGKKYIAVESIQVITGGEMVNRFFDWTNTCFV